MHAKPDPPAVAVVVPTRDRPDDLEVLLAALARQSLAPRVVIVVDSSAQPSAPKTDPRLPLRVVATPPGLAGAQRNTGIAIALEDTSAEYIALLDDDVEPADDYLLRLVDGLERNPDSAGISGVAMAVGPAGTTTARSVSAGRRALLRAAGLGGTRSGSLLSSGINIGHLGDGRPGLIEAEWLIGCSIWRRSVMTACRFDDDPKATFLGDDVLFSLEARRHGRLLIDPSVMLPHRMSDIGRHSAPMYWAEWVRGRRRIVARAPNGSVTRYWIATAVAMVPLAVTAAAGSAEHRETMRSVRGAVADVMRGRY